MKKPALWLALGSIVLGAGFAVLSPPSSIQHTGDRCQDQGCPRWTRDWLALQADPARPSAEVGCKLSLCMLETWGC